MATATSPVSTKVTYPAPSSSSAVDHMYPPTARYTPRTGSW